MTFPELTPRPKRSYKLQVSLTPDEISDVKHGAAENDMNLSEFVGALVRAYQQAYGAKALTHRQANLDDQTNDLIDAIESEINMIDKLHGTDAGIYGMLPRSESE